MRHPKNLLETAIGKLRTLSASAIPRARLERLTTRATQYRASLRALLATSPNAKNGNRLAALSMRAKLYGAFGLILSTLIVAGVVSAYKLHVVSSYSQNIVERQIPKALGLFKLRIMVDDYRATLIAHAGSLDGDEMNALAERHTQLGTAIDRAVADADSAAQAGDMSVEQVAQFRQSWLDFKQLGDEVIGLSNGFQKEQAALLFSDQGSKLFRAAADGLQGLLTQVEGEFSETRQSAVNTSTNARNSILLVMILGAALAVSAAFYTSQTLIHQIGGEPAYAAAVVQRIAAGDFEHPVEASVRGPSLLADMGTMQENLRQFIDSLLQMSVAHERGETRHFIDAERYPGAFGRIAVAINSLVQSHLQLQQQSMALMGRYAIGDLSADMPDLPGEKAVIAKTMAQVKTNLLRLNEDLQSLVLAARNGSFDERGDPKRHQYAYREMIESLNALMAAADDGLSDVGAVLAAMANGDLTRTVERRHEGAFGRLSEDANAMVGSLKTIIGSVKEAADVIDSASGEIARGNDDLANRTSSQSMVLEQTLGALRSLTATVHRNTEDCRKAQALSHDAREVAAKGGDMVEKVVATMSEISQSSARINEIVGTIQGIAFQTNILALNAAVEAARAGEQGRGFAVVAGEVRSLATRSSDAARQIQSMIRDSAETVSEGVGLVRETGQTMLKIVSSVSQVAQLISDIAAASADQSKGIENVGETMAQMDSVAQQNAALVEEASAAAASLAGQARGLTATISAFRTSAVGVDAGIRAGLRVG